MGEAIGILNDLDVFMHRWAFSVKVHRPQCLLFFALLLQNQHFVRTLFPFKLPFERFLLPQIMHNLLHVFHYFGHLLRLI
jgi:hypothetical protein